jgi:VanZ like family
MAAHARAATGRGLARAARFGHESSAPIGDRVRRAAAASVRPAAAAAPREGELRRSDRWQEGTTIGWRGFAIGYAALLAWFTVLPSQVNRALLPVDVDRLVDPWTVARSVLIGAAVAAILLSWLGWRHRRAWRSRLSWPVRGWLAACLCGLALLVLLGQPPRYLDRAGLGWFQGFADDFDVRHVIAYFGFAIVVATAWRGRVGLPGTGVLLAAYGLVLELAQELVPTRNFRIKDLVSNGLGILLGLSWVWLYDLVGRPRETGLVAGRASAAAPARRPPAPAAGGAGCESR